MDHSNLRQSASASKIASIDVGQLDKINAIPNKTRDNVLMDGLCQEDQLYLNALIDEDSSGSEDRDEHTNPSRQMSSAWSPMAQSPMMMMSGSGGGGAGHGSGKAKRMRRMRPAYAITLSLEDISYIRPSWGLSKGIKRIDVKKKRKKVVGKEKSVNKTTKTTTKSEKQAREFGVEHDEEETGTGNNDDDDDYEGEEDEEEKKRRRAMLTAYHLFLLLIITLVVSLVALSYYVDSSRYKKRIVENGIKLEAKSRIIDIFRSRNDKLFDNFDPLSGSASSNQRTFRVNFGQAIPANLKGEKCSCDEFELEARRFNGQLVEADLLRSSRNDTCFACLDWSMRANLRVKVSREQQPIALAQMLLDASLAPQINCYNFKWQSYDSLATPLVDCFQLNSNEEQWFGLGDLQTAAWSLNKLDFERVPLQSNLSADFGFSSAERLGDILGNKLSQGAYVNFTLFTSSGFFLGNLKTDFQPSIWISHKAKQLCLSVDCTERCSQTWSREDQLEALRFSNNLLEYQVCSGANWRELVARQTSLQTEQLAAKFLNETNRTHESLVASGDREPLVSGLDEGRPQQAILQSPTRGSAGSAQQPEQAPASTEAGAPAAAPAAESVNELVPVTPTRRQQSIAEGIGLIDRTIFATTQEFMPTLDGQTLRQFADNIVKLGLKTSPILLVDSRWQISSGSLRLNSFLFPKAKLLFEILHNKGFKIVLNLKPYVDTELGVAYISSLTEAGRLCRAETRGRAKTSPGSLDVFHSVEFNLTRRSAFFQFSNETIRVASKKENKIPLFHPSKSSNSGYFALIDLTEEKNRDWLIERIKQSNWLSQEADGIQFGGTHPDGFQWDDHFRAGLGRLIDDLFYRENLYTMPQWTGNFGYMQLAPRPRTWTGLKSTLDSVLNLGSLGFVLMHPGSVWGDLRGELGPAPTPLGPIDGLDQSRPDEQQELAIRWLQMSIFLPILQFNDLTPIERFALHDLLQNLVKIRKIHVVPEIKKHLPFTPLIGDTKSRQKLALSTLGKQRQLQGTLPVIRHVWHALGDTSGSETIVDRQFFVGTDILVAPIVAENQRQRDIFLPSGLWHDELRQTNIRGGKWLRNYPVELNEVAWFTRARRR